MPKNLLIIGQCGSGKTWVMRQLIEIYQAKITEKCGLFCYHRNQSNIIVGKYDGSMFQGSDRLSMALMKDAGLFARSSASYNVIGEGDRLTNKTYISRLKPKIIRIMDDGARGREARGSRQTARHIQAIATRVANIQSDYDVPDSQAALAAVIELLGKN